jgi:hypothetical protein
VEKGRLIAVRRDDASMVFAVRTLAPKGAAAGVARLANALSPVNAARQVTPAAGSAVRMERAAAGGATTISVVAERLVDIRADSNVVTIPTSAAIGSVAAANPFAWSGCSVRKVPASRKKSAARPT